MAALGAGDVAPNPMVGCVIVRQGKIIGEGFHRQCGGWHAEVYAVQSVANQEWLKESTLYVSLEPCAHFGKTPPCSDLIIAKGIPRVVVGTADPYAEVAGKGIEKMRRAGIEVTTGVLEDECRDINRRFFTFHQMKRPYIILKWAETPDGFIDHDRSPESRLHPAWITNELSRRVVHKCRAQEGAILVGTHTALADNPALTVREWSGRGPLRLLLDRRLRLPDSLKLFDQSQPTLVFTEKPQQPSGTVEFISIDFTSNVPRQIAAHLYDRKILSLIVEGGAITLRHFIEQELWDEAHIYTGSVRFGRGVKAPSIVGRVTALENLDDSLLTVLRRVPSV